MAQNGGIVVRHKDLEVADPAFLRPDGVHLNAIGLNLWNLGTKGSIERALHLWWDNHAQGIMQGCHGGSLGSP